MSIQVHLHHRTSYDYDRAVKLSPQVIRLRPASHSRTVVSAYSLKVSPEPHFLNWQQDPFGNWLARVVFPGPVRHFTVEVGLTAELRVINPFDFFVEDFAKRHPFAYPEPLRGELAPYLETEAEGPLLAEFMAAWKRTPRPVETAVDMIVALNQAVYSRVAYTIRMEPGVQSCEETLSLGKGSCRDSAWLLVEILRRLGLAARFVSGYLIQLRPDEPPAKGPAGVTQDFTDLHAWTEVYLPGAGWIGLDPTSGLFAGEGHIPLSATPRPGSSAPISGLTDPCKTEFSFEMKIERLGGPPRVTAPYDDATWEKILHWGEWVDEDLERSGARLTQGGEPTFVSTEDIEAPEWNIAALGASKSRKASEWLDLVSDERGEGALHHFGQGKWYPGEVLPRWVRSCYYRKDGTALWRRKDLFADPEKPGERTFADLRNLARAVAERFGFEGGAFQSCFEDLFYYTWVEGGLPASAASAPKVAESSDERKRLRRLLDDGLAEPVALVLPLARDGERWRTEPWVLTREKVFLVPGDSPAGLRLPLSSLQSPAEDDAEIPAELAGSPFTPRGALPDFRKRVAERLGLSGKKKTQAASSPIGTALVLELREGRLHVFLPPQTTLEAWMDCLETVQEAVEALSLPVVVEGYGPPSDERMGVFRITPDPGVLEVNVAPVKGWKALVEQTTRLYAEAKTLGLRAEKFALDGKHTGTGGGHHLVFGGAHPSDSPFLRRPDLLRSMITFWQHHPSLSYLFAGQFIGPTSQAPRVDEARTDTLYELDIAFAAIDRAVDEAAIEGAKSVPPWFVDRALRNFLIDASGNTHRAEFSIDKMYSPDTSTGRLGLVELRGFEMAPHPRMSLAQSLLVRSLISVFLRKPYRHRSHPWGTALHDRFLLPHWIVQDFQEVLSFLRHEGVRLETSFFQPFFEFRFPLLGSVESGSMTLELRQALEPWHVLGEEVAGSGTARYVDSSVERLEVKVRNLPPRATVAVNGFRLPLLPTGVQGESAAGVRYKAWAPYSALHPSIAPQGPIRVQVIEEGTFLPILAATYHVSHPGGRSYDTYPVNASEAEARRASRFERIARESAPVPLKTPPPNPAFPHTLDLRFAGAGGSAGPGAGA